MNLIASKAIYTDFNENLFTMSASTFLSGIQSLRYGFISFPNADDSIYIVRVSFTDTPVFAKRIVKLKQLQPLLLSESKTKVY